MENLEILLIVVGIISGVCTVYCLVLPYLKKKNINAVSAVQNAEKGLKESEAVIKAAQAIVPSNKELMILDIIDNLALRSTKAMEQLAISGQLPLEKRRETAKENILAGLKAFDIPVDENLDKVIDDAVQEFVYDSKTEDEKKTQKQNILQKQIVNLQ